MERKTKAELLLLLEERDFTIEALKTEVRVLKERIEALKVSAVSKNV